ncbi:hypothetical protein MBLNU230_g6132t1 [Neophaeotheca triangularis]
MASKLTFQSTLNLNTGAKLPALGFGVYESPAEVTTKSCIEALKVGYRHIDTAQYYANEKEVGEAVRQSGLQRKDVFITSKIISPGSTDEETEQALRDTVRKIDGEDGYVDLMLIHNGSVGAEKRKKLWLALEKLQQQGKFKAIGVSNFGIGQINELKDYAQVWPPSVNQLELHPWNQQREVVDFCHKNGIAVEAYCPIVRNQKKDDPDLKGIADKVGKSTSQVLIRYALQKAWAPLPKSDNPERIAANSDLFGFELSKEDMEKLDAKDQGGKGALVMAVDNN